jgi:threonylcarbamoyladenosine tRNA methylthiotransferase CDKAL1
MKKIFIKTYGCSFNQADSENMAGLLDKSGYELVDNEEKADMIIVNSCTVKNKAENKFWRDISDIKKLKKPVIMAGCVPQAEKDKSKFGGYSVIGTNQINNVVEVVDETFSGNIVQLLKKEENKRLNIPKIRKNSIIEIVPINEGCLGSCNFCATKFARGHLVSYEPKAIVKQIRSALNDGCKEIWLTSQDTACYGYDFATQQNSRKALQTSKFSYQDHRKNDINSSKNMETDYINTNIVELLKEILAMKRDFKLRLGMGNPDYLPDYLDEIIDVFHDKRLYKFIHIPVQAGSDKVLRAMKREYTVKTFKNIIKKFKQVHPDITVATDIIVGYPDETDDDFDKTMNLVKELEFDVINISRFWPRPGTIAAKKKPLSTKLVKERSIKLMNLFEKISKKRNDKWVGWTGSVLINEKGKNDSFVARNYAYKPIIVKGDYVIGQEVDVKVKRATTFNLRC